MKDKYSDIKLVEKAIINSDDVKTTAGTIKRDLKEKVSPKVIDAILAYFEAKRYTDTGSKGIIWVHNPKLAALLRNRKEIDYP